LVSEVTNGSIKMSDLVGESGISRFKLGTSGFTVMKGNLEVVAFNSTGVELSTEIGNSGVEVSILVREVCVGILQLGASGLAGGELCGGTIKRGCEIGILGG